MITDAEFEAFKEESREIVFKKLCKQVDFIEIHSDNVSMETQKII